MFEMYNLSVRNTMGMPSEAYLQSGMQSLGGGFGQGPDHMSVALMGRTDSLA